MYITAEEKQILDFLEAQPEVFFSMIEICRKAGSTRQYREDPRWAARPLISLREKGLIEDDGGGHYAFVPEEEEEEEEGRPPGG